MSKQSMEKSRVYMYCDRLDGPQPFVRVVYRDRLDGS